MVLVHAALLTWSAVRNSVTIDEYAHISAGAAYWRYGEWSIYNHNPPLLRLWAAWPLFLAGAEVPDSLAFIDEAPKDRFWNYADAFADANRDKYHRLVIAARLPMIALSCGGILLVFAIAAHLYGRAAGIASAVVFAFCPNLMAHGGIVATDAGTAVLMLAAVWTWIRFCLDPTPPRCALAGVALAAALLCKFTALLLLPLMLLIGVWGIAVDHRRLRLIAAGAACVLLIALLLINLVYGYHGSFRALNQYEFDSIAMQTLQSRLPRWLPVPLPRDLVEGLDAVKWEIEQPFQAFLLGEAYTGTRRWYYPIALLAKTPLATLGLIALACVTMLLPKTRLKWRNAEAALLISLVFLTIGIIGGATVNIGMRYMLPVVPIAIVLLARIYAKTDIHISAKTNIAPPPRRLRLTATILVALLIVEVLPTTPRFLTFFNLAAGGSIGGQRVLNDSNCDWGQGLIELRRWMEDNNVHRIWLAYFGRVDPAIYDINYTALDEPSDARYLVVSSFYQTGLAYRAPTPRGRVVLRLPPTMLSALRSIKPVAIVGKVMYVYEQQDVVEAIRRARS